MFSVCLGLAGSGTVLTRVAPMASPPPPAPQPCPLGSESTAEYTSRPAVMAKCRPTDHARARPQRSCSKKISAFAAILFQGLGHDTDIRYPRLLHCIHHCGKCAEGDVLVRAHKDELVARVANLLPQLDPDFIDVNGVVAQEDALILVD